MGAPEPLLVGFAIDVTERLATISQGLRGSGEDQFCPSFSAALWLINQQLQGQETPTSGLDTRLLKLLSNLERICKPQSSLSYRRQPGPLRTGKEGLDLAQRYPGLDLLRHNNRKSAVEGIRKLSSGQRPESTKRKHDLLKILEAFGGALVAEDQVSDPKTKKDIWTGDDFTGSIRTLHQVLSEYMFCDAGSQKKEIAGRLRLAVESDQESDSPTFDMMFLAHPHNELHEESFRWRETRIRVKKRKPKFKGDEKKDVQLLIGGQIHTTEFCERISAREQYQLSLVVSDKQLGFVEWCEGAKSWVPNSPSVSLNTILRNHKLSRKMKYLLSYLLAKSVWQFYSTDWMGTEWSKDSIHFMFEHRKSASNAGIYLNEPFILARFNPDAKIDDSVFRPHKFPKIKALGILLLEIELGTVIEDHFGPDCFAPDGQPNADADLYATLKLYDDPDILEDSFPLLKTVIGECLRPSKFMQHRHSVEELRKVFQDHVVDPLHTIVGLYGQPDKIKLRPTVQMPPTQSLQVAYQHQKVPSSDTKIVEGHQVIETATFKGSMASCIGQASSEDWFDELDNLNAILSSMPDEVDQTYKRVRVVVIDTGIDGTDPYAKHIRDYKDFVSKKDDVKQDKTGHGTNSVKLIFKVYAQAEVYVARVFESNHANDDTQDLMLEAIQHAKDVWKADVITIASGFEKDHANMRKAIKRVASDGTLVFAAASNYGNIRQVTFPARMQDVVCMYCTDGRAKVSPSINPAPQTSKSKNFAILGEGVMVPPSIGQRLTGTSVATSIAAGLAGRLLDFSRQIDGQQRIRCVGNLASVEGISAVFSHMAKGAQDYKYNCVVPGRLLQHLDDDLERKVKRKRICETLSGALENIDLDG